MQPSRRRNALSARPNWLLRGCGAMILAGVLVAAAGLVYFLATVTVPGPEDSPEESARMIRNYRIAGSLVASGLCGLGLGLAGTVVTVRSRRRSVPAKAPSPP